MSIRHVRWEAIDEAQRMAMTGVQEFPSFLAKDGRMCRPNYEDQVITLVRPGERLQG